MKIFGYSVEECLTFFMLIVVGYFIAKLFSQKCNSFSVGAVSCEGQNPGKCKVLSNCRWNESESKCTDINAIKPIPALIKCNKNEDCKSGICHQNPITKLGNCVNKCSDLNPRACRVHPDKCKVENNNCMSKKELGEKCKLDSDCQSGICHEHFMSGGLKCSECEDVHWTICKAEHGDVCKVDNMNCVPKK